MPLKYPLGSVVLRLQTDRSSHSSLLELINKYVIETRIPDFISLNYYFLIFILLNYYFLLFISLNYYFLIFISLNYYFLIFISLNY